MASTEKKDIRLYSLFSKLSTNISNKDYLGSIISYTIVEGLLTFTSNVGKSRLQKPVTPESIRFLNKEGLQQFRFEEIKRIYRTFNTRIDSLLKNNETEEFNHVSKHCNPEIEKYTLNNNVYEKQSVLLFQMLENLKNDKNYPDSLRKKGITLYEIVKLNKPYGSSSNIMMYDYD